MFPNIRGSFFNDWVIYINYLNFFNNTCKIYISFEINITMYNASHIIPGIILYMFNVIIIIIIKTIITKKIIMIITIIIMS